MITVRVRTNLDLHGEEWPRYLPAVPSIGHLIESSTHHEIGSGSLRLQLEVASVIWTVSKGEPYIPQIELHLPRGRFRSLREFYEWYAPRVGKTVSSFL
jgi:hypothetical protein